jgi:hypothetical protein
MRVSNYLAAAVSALIIGGCNMFAAVQDTQPFDILIKVESDPGAPVGGASISHNGKVVSSTGIDGRAKLTLPGKEGDALDFSVECPAEFVSPNKPITVYLHRMADKTKLAEYNTVCPPSTRKLVVSVRAENGPYLPVLYLGKPVARTDASGTAHILLMMRPGDQFELQLDTSEKGNERLRPKMPTGTFAMREHDDLQSFDQKFFLEKQKVVFRAGPTRAVNIATGAGFGQPEE